MNMEFQSPTLSDTIPR